MVRRSCCRRWSRWTAETWLDLIGGAGTGATLVEPASQHLGCGDLGILAERNRYLERTSGTTAEIWPLDGQLASYS
jgi:hypothetical protein